MKKRVEVTTTKVIEVEIDETKMTPEWMESFREYFYPFHTIDEHLEHLAQMFARGVEDGYRFIEGYGEPKEMGIRFDIVDEDTGVIDV